MVGELVGEIPSTVSTTGVTETKLGLEVFEKKDPFGEPFDQTVIVPP